VAEASARRWLCAACTLTLLGGACVKQTNARARRAFDGARGSGSTAGGTRSETVTGGGGGTYEVKTRGWSRVSTLLGIAVDTLRAHPDDAALAELAGSWCFVEPEPKDTVDGRVRVCNPDPPVTAGGATFTLELGTEGVIGLVAADLSSESSERVATEARDAATGLCDGAWAQVPRPEAAEPTFHTCPAKGGPVVTVGRFPHRPGSARWLVSVAVLSPG